MMNRVVKKPAARQGQNERSFHRLEYIYDGGENLLFGRYEERKRDGKTQFLIKQSMLGGGTDEDLRWSMDVLSWSQLLHVNVLRYADSWMSGERVYVLCENARLCLSVCLQQMADSDGGRPAPCKELCASWMFHLASALEYMHGFSQPMLHRNVQPDNVMVTDRCVLKLCAFGSARRLESEGHKAKTCIGAQGLFLSPERSRHHDYGQAADVWGFGVTAAFIVNVTRAKKCGSSAKLVEIVERSGHGPCLVAVVRSALQEDPGLRPSALEIVRQLRTESPGVGDPVPPDHYPPPFRNEEVPSPAPSPNGGAQSLEEKHNKDGTTQTSVIIPKCETSVQTDKGNSYVVIGLLGVKDGKHVKVVGASQSHVSDQPTYSQRQIKAVLLKKNDKFAMVTTSSKRSTGKTTSSKHSTMETSETSSSSPSTSSRTNTTSSSGRSRSTAPMSISSSSSLATTPRDASKVFSPRPDPHGRSPRIRPRPRHPEDFSPPPEDEIDNDTRLPVPFIDGHNSGDETGTYLYPPPGHRRPVNLEDGARTMNNDVMLEIARIINEPRPTQQLSTDNQQFQHHLHNRNAHQPHRDSTEETPRHPQVQQQRNPRCRSRGRHVEED